jgi:hypothetical protein
MNRKALSTANVTTIGKSEIKIGKYCYLESENALFYIEQITHAYSVGDKYTTSLTLSYRRNPVLKLTTNNSGFLASTTTDNDEFNHQVVKTFLDAIDYTESNSWYKISPSACFKTLNSIKKNMKNLGYQESFVNSMYNTNNLQDFYFNGYIWEPTIETDFSKMTSTNIIKTEKLKKIEMNIKKITGMVEQA